MVVARTVPGVVETAALLRELTARLIGGTDLDEALGRLARIARDAVPGATGCGVTLLRGGGPAAVAATDPRLRDLDHPRHGADGPAMTAIRRRELVRVAELTGETRWRRWTRRAVGLGVNALIAAPFDVDDQVIGSLNLYARRRPGLTDSDQLTAMLLAEHAGLLLAAVRDRAGRTAPVDDAVGSDSGTGVIGQAIGVIMTQRGCPAPEALRVLRTASSALSIPLREVAERLVSSVARPRRS
ncbi:GAF and ANTAR domain-containing protein [Solwaraspora sp. WMMD1047]|uniref:GAF and ANTAR domain-containing protein n=1 Tax=Solwaraspora sp. WMMD1047 TaxID=3016102 RepID=UPI002416BAE6|nr:GAF and ANTAR domain-containing protein [Solwaraspora sp. WMMD1047]MDG4831264.1 GAF and ANTAR domain-containing protein [Solwaraspora sp. WMMD1047]